MIEVTLAQFIMIITIGTVLFVLIMWFFFRLYKNRRFQDSFDYEYLKTRQEKINSWVNGDSDSEYALALIEADKLLDYFLKARHFAGNTLGERLKVAGYRFPELRKVWPAHKMRNRIVHESSVKISQSQVKSYWRDYQKAYRILMR